MIRGQREEEVPSPSENTSRFLHHDMLNSWIDLCSDERFHPVCALAVCSKDHIEIVQRTFPQVILFPLARKRESLHLALSIITCILNRKFI